MPSADELLEQVRGRNGLGDFGDESFVAPFRSLVSAINETAELHPFGSFLARRVLTVLLANRLYVEHAWKRRTGADPPLGADPVLITGLPRSGTTFLFHLLACDPAHRTLANWEASRPAPPPGWWNRRRPVRRAYSAAGLCAQRYLSPGLERLHPVRTDGPEECTALLMAGFASQAFAALFHVPRYLDALRGHDYTPSIQYHRRQLQILDGPRPGARWLLKSPNHLPALGAVLAVYPGARIIQTHRELTDVVPSCAKLVAEFRRIFSDREDPREIEECVNTVLSEALRRSAAARRAAPASRCFDVAFEDLVAEPMEVVRAAYRHFDLDLGGVAEAGMRATIRRARNRGAWSGRPSPGVEPFSVPLVE